MKYKKTKRILSILLTLCLTLSFLLMSACASTECARDLDGHWAESAIKTLNEYGIMSGVGNGYFVPDRDITHAELATLINCSLGYDALGLAGNALGPWYAGDVQTAYALGFMNGVEPHGRITREQAAVILYGILRLNAPDGTATRFTDIDEVSPDALDAVLAMERLGYMVGHNNRFMPKGYVTRGQAAQLLLNVFGVLIDDDFDAGGRTHGNVTIRRPDVTLSNAIITGDLFITEGVGDGTIWLDTLRIDGRLIIAGGGENSIHVRNITVGENVVVDKPAVAGDEPVRFRVARTSDTIVLFEGTMREVIICEDITVIIDSDGQVTRFNLFAPEDGAERQAVVISEGAAVDKITIFTPAEISGGGDVGLVEAHTPGVAIGTGLTVDVIEAGEGVPITVAEGTVIGTGITDPTPQPEPEPFPGQEPIPQPTPAPSPQPTPGPTTQPTPPPSGGNGGDTGGGTPGPTTRAITMQNDGNGTASASHNSASSGTTITITATPNAGFQFKQWVVVSGGVTLSGTAANPATFVMPASAVTIRAEFEPVAPPTIGGTASVAGTNAIGQMLTVNTVSITGGSGAFSYQWQADGADISGATSATYTLQGADAGKTITCIVTRADADGSVTATLGGGVVPYDIVIVNIGNIAGDTVVTLSADKGRVNDSITLNYVLGSGGTANSALNFTGVMGLTDLTAAGQNTSQTYTVAASDAVNGVITITATFVHTNLALRTLSFPSATHTVTFGDSNFTNTATPSAGTGTITYVSSNTAVATVNASTGEVTIVGQGSTSINATIPADATHAGYTTSYMLTVNRLDITGGTVGTFGALTFTGAAQTPVATVTINGLTATGSWSQVANVADTTTFTASGNFIGTTAAQSPGMTKADPTVTWPSGLTATVGQTLSDVTLPGNGTGAGTFTWTALGNSVGAEGTQSHNMTFTPSDTTNFNTITQNVTITVNPVPTWGISLSQSGTHTFPAAVFGYGPQTALSVTITNTGNQNTGPLNIDRIGGTHTFAATGQGQDIAPGDSATFTIQPLIGLGVGAYTATVTVSGGNGISASFNVSFTVNPAPPTRIIDLSIANPTIGIGWTFNSTTNVYTINDTADVIVTGDNAGSQRRLEVTANATATITLDGMSITGLSVVSPALLLGFNSNVILNLADGTTNTLTGGTSSAGIRTSGATLTINGDTGILIANGGSSAAGIGGNISGTGGTVTINGGTVTVNGGYNAAGIGGGGGTGGGGTVTINGGTVTATANVHGSGTNSAGIGGGSAGNGGIVTINGGTVTATGLRAIGAGASSISNNGTLTMSGYAGGWVHFAGANAGAATEPKPNADLEDDRLLGYLRIQPGIAPSSAMAPLGFTPDFTGDCECDETPCVCDDLINDDPRKEPDPPVVAPDNDEETPDPDVDGGGDGTDTDGNPDSAEEHMTPQEAIATLNVLLATCVAAKGV